MTLTDEQKSAALEWARTDSKMQKLFRELDYELFYGPIIHFAVAFLIFSTCGVSWFALWWKTLGAAPNWWFQVFAFMSTVGCACFGVATVDPSNKVRVTLGLTGAILLSIPYVIGVTTHIFP
ncbi:hypothetical protein AA0472_2759 [Acetobacter estunensis NRIC 0472]|uniref:Uncharacterized protein n=1 Tax=Acetobacter estunensis TaxID=104097 RepID=A0A967BE79_9PROT|nr:hypothetical protein [Acetobacter estunensis]NHO55458.1 hypothetical protein [Acetobacter estunensis]GBQ28631.1 hypothetical protein AA0472_2759 [Acetobacter estunensis NRIC 0472]